MSDQIHSYAELKQQIHKDLRTQHPEWIESNGKCPECDEYEARLKEVLEALPRSESNTEAEQRVLVKDEQPGSSDESC